MALNLPFYPLESLALEGVKLVRTAVEYREKTGREAPAFDKTVEPKLWLDDRPALPVLVNYLVAQVAAGGAVELRTVTLSRSFAGKVNIPSGSELSSGDILPPIPFPIRMPDADEELVTSVQSSGLSGANVMVRNRKLWEQLAGAGGSVDLRPALEKLDQIIGMLKRSGIGV